MNFSDSLNSYINSLGITAKDLSVASGVSAAAISRYRAGERTPDPDGEHLRLLAQGLVALSEGSLDEREVINDLAESISGLAVDYGTYLANMHALLATVSISNGALARALGYDPSFISRVLSGLRRPADPQAFIEESSGAIADHVINGELFEDLDEELGLHIDPTANRAECAQAIAVWVSTNYRTFRDPVGGFLGRLDSFNLKDFVRDVQFDDIQASTEPPQLPTTKTYYGLREMMAAEIDFLQETRFSKSSADVIMFSDMPLQEMADDPAFFKQWLFDVSGMLNQGFHLSVIHNTDRPLVEMMFIFEGWIPLYITGLVSPYYYNRMQSGVFRHLLRVSGTVALWGESINGHQDEGRYILTKNRDDVRYLRRRATRMLETACPLMRIVTKKNADELKKFEAEKVLAGESYRFVFSSLPLATIPLSTLENMLDRMGEERVNALGADRQSLIELVQCRRSVLDSLVDQGYVTIEIPDLTPEEFASHPVHLETSGGFIEGEFVYTYDEYLEHLEATRAYTDEHESCTLVVNSKAPFRNIQIFICEGKSVVVSRNKGPAAHFIIEQPEIVAIFERFAASMGY